MKKSPSKKGLSGVPIISDIANSRAAEKAVEKGFSTTGTIVKVVVGTLVIGSVVVFGPKMYKKWRQKTYARKHIGDPNVQAAIIIRKAFTKLEFPPVLNWVFSDFILWTNEEQLFKIARKVTSIEKVAKAYSILFDAVLLQDLQSGFSSDEFKKFFEIIQGKDGNPTPSRVIPLGKTIYWAMKNPANIYEAYWDKNLKKWRQKNTLWKTANYNEEIGKVYRVEKHSEQSRYYIVDGGVFKSGYGLVWDNQIKDHLD